MTAAVQDEHRASAMRIRPMQESDLEQVHYIDQVSFSLPWPKKAFWYELIENQNSLLWVAENASPLQMSVITGMIVVWFIVDEAHIATLAVHPDYRNRGIARALVRVALIRAMQKGAISATLEVRASNLVAQHLYQSLGFSSVGRRKRYYKDNNEDAIIMTLENIQEMDFSNQSFDRIENSVAVKSQQNQGQP